MGADVVAMDRAVTLSELERWGEEFGHTLPPDAVVALSGDLGAGKTTLVQSICRGFGVTDAVTSPTFGLVHRYGTARSPVYHLDLFRLTSAAELTNLAFDDMLAEGALVLVEWPERAGRRLPDVRFNIHLEHLAGDPSRRRLQLR